MKIDLKIFSFALLATVALTACDKAVTGGNANAPGSPGTGNAASTSVPLAADTPPGGSSGKAGTAATSGSSGGSAVPGVTGRGTAEPGSRSQSAQPGVGTTGGLSGSSGLGMTGSFPASGASAAGSGSGAAGSGSGAATSR